MYPPPFMPPGGGPDMTGAAMPGFEGADGMGDNDVDWRNLFVQELERLKSMTKEQDKNGAPQEWYRMMLMRLKMGMYGVPPFGAPIPPHPDARRGPEVQHAQQQPQQHSTIEEEHEAEEEEDE
jgi:forkhead box protein J2/3